MDKSRIIGVNVVVVGDTIFGHTVDGGRVGSFFRAAHPRTRPAVGAKCANCSMNPFRIDTVDAEGQVICDGMHLVGRFNQLDVGVIRQGLYCLRAAANPGNTAR